MAIDKDLIPKLNKALAWELRAAIVYGHYAAYIMGRDRLDFEDHFKEESTESMGHAAIVRQIIADLGGKAVTAPDPAPVKHADDLGTMLKEALKIEQAAEKGYRALMPLLTGYPTYLHSVGHILMSEEKAVLDLKRLLG